MGSGSIRTGAGELVVVVEVVSRCRARGWATEMGVGRLNDRGVWRSVGLGWGVAGGGGGGGGCVGGGVDEESSTLQGLSNQTLTCPKFGLALH